VIELAVIQNENGRSDTHLSPFRVSGPTT
jgi:hypothetical protein